MPLQWLWASEGTCVAHKQSECHLCDIIERTRWHKDGRCREHEILRCEHCRETYDPIRLAKSIGGPKIEVEQEGKIDGFDIPRVPRRRSGAMYVPGLRKHRSREGELQNTNSPPRSEPGPEGIWWSIRPEGKLPQRFETDIVRQRESVGSKLRGAFSSSSSKTIDQDIDQVDRMYRDMGSRRRPCPPHPACHSRPRTVIGQQCAVYVRGLTDESWTELSVSPSTTLRNLLDTWSRSPERWMHCSGSDGNMNYEKLSGEVLGRSVGEHLRGCGGRYFMIHDSAWKSNWSVIGRRSIVEDVEKADEIGWSAGGVLS